MNAFQMPAVRRGALAVVLVAGVTALGAGCGSSSDSSTSTSSAAPAAGGPPATSAPASSTPVASTPAPSGGSAPAGKMTEVKVVDFGFEPTESSVKVGDTVKWTWTGKAPHDVLNKDGEFTSGEPKTSGDFTRTFTKAGSFAYVCTVHPNMTGTITVTG